MSVRAGVAVRDARDSDLPRIHAIYSHHVTTGLGSFEEVPPPLEELARRRAGVLAGGFPYLVAEIDGTVAGYAYAGPYRTRSAYRYTVEDSIYVAPEFQRRGVGAALLAELVRRCEAAGYRQMLAVIGDSGNSGSIGVHAAQGFKEVARMTAIGFKFGRWVDSVVMQRPLGPGQTRPPDR